MPEHLVRKPYIGPLAQHVDDLGARPPHDEIEQRRHHDADEQHIERVEGFRRNHPVVDLLRKDDPGQPKGIRRQGRDHDMAIGPQIRQGEAAQPAFAIRGDVIVDAFVHQRPQRTRDHKLADARHEVGDGDDGGVLLARQKQPRFTRLAERGDDPDGAVVEFADHRQAPGGQFEFLRRIEPNPQPQMATQKRQLVGLRFPGIPCRTVQGGLR
jgi:hypothetical protein